MVEGVAPTKRHRMRAGRRPIEATWLMITDAGGWGHRRLMPARRRSGLAPPRGTAQPEGVARTGEKQRRQRLYFGLGDLVHSPQKFLGLLDRELALPDLLRQCRMVAAHLIEENSVLQGPSLAQLPNAERRHLPLGSTGHQI